MIERFYKNIDKLLKPNRALIIYGPRRIGKTTLLKDYLNKTKYKYLLDTGDNVETGQIFGLPDFEKIIDYAAKYELIAIDEAQMIPNVGSGLKILVDHVPNIKVIATGSSSFDLANQVGEPLTGRKITINLYPILQLELLSIFNKYELKKNLHDFLIFGSYPEVITAKTRIEKITIIKEIVTSYLLKDVLAFERIKSPKVLLDLIKLLAFQIGSEVSFNELATKLSINARTVARYIDLLEKSFIIVNLGSFSRNLRKEVTRKNKYYFLDNGIRNGVIDQFNDLDKRDDIGKLWENFIIMERIKMLDYKKIYGHLYFWRTYEQKEIDIVEERDGKLSGYEIKWKKDKIKPPKDWLATYKNAEYKVISQDNYLDYVL
ncbi:MAG: AAA family ATPase [Candidatus Falkowbacteria bacterium]